MSVPARNVTPQTPASIRWRRLLLRLVDKGAIAPSALDRPSGPSRAADGHAPTGARSGAVASPSCAGGGVHLLEADRRSRLAATGMRRAVPQQSCVGGPLPSPCPGRDLA